MILILYNSLLTFFLFANHTINFFLPSIIHSFLTNQDCTRADSADIEEAIKYAPLALEFVYHSSKVEIQRLAMSQGWATLYIKESTEPEQPAFALFATAKKNPGIFNP